MYELVKQKSRGKRILIGIAIFFLVTTLLREVLRAPVLTIDEQLVEIASEINSKAPITIDSLTRLDNVIPQNGRVLQYNYTITHIDRELIDSAAMVTEGRSFLLNAMKTDPKAAFFRNYEVEIQAHYSDKDGRFLAEYSVKPGEY
jgi:hypothetical protein